MHKFFNQKNSIRSINLLLIVILLAILYKMTGRSAWIDEGMLLKNITENKSYFDFIEPLPFYDQAQPLMASVFFKALIEYFSDSLQEIRMGVLLTSLAVVTPIAVLLCKDYKWGIPVALAVFLSNVFGFGFYLTEIKHYFLEILASFMLIAALYVFEKNKNIPLCFFLILISSVIGFSTLIPCSMLMTYVATYSIINEKIVFKKYLFFFAGLFLVIASGYVHMKYLTEFQINNYQAYLNKSTYGDILTLGAASLEAYGLTFFVISFIATTLVFLYEKNTYLFKLNVFFTLLVFLIISAKIFGFYPVVFGRHLVWLVPFSAVIVTSSALSFLNDNRPLWKLFGITLISGIALQSGSVIYRAYAGNFPEYTANNKLYNFLTTLKKSEILIYPHAQSTFEFYFKINSGLKIHSYYGLYDNKSSKKNPNNEKSQFSSRLDYMLDSRPKSDFILLVSHLDNIYSSTLSERAVMLKYKIEINGCSYKDLFFDNNVQLLEIHCKVAES